MKKSVRSYLSSGRSRFLALGSFNNDFRSLVLPVGFAVVLFAVGAAGLQPKLLRDVEREPAPAGAMVLRGIPAPLPTSDAPAVTIDAEGENDLVIDMAALNIHPTAEPHSVRRPESAAVGNTASFSISPEIGNQNTPYAFVAIGANFVPGETVQVFINGSLSSSGPAGPTGRIGVYLSTNASYGYLAIDLIGTISGRETGGVVMVSNTGPYLPGLAAGPHAVNPTGSTTVATFVTGFLPAGTPLTFRRNGVSIATGTSDANGGGVFLLNVPAGPDTSAVYTVDSGAAGSMAGVSIEERSDAGTPPIGDQNLARAFVDRAVVDSAVGGTVAIVAEGFTPGETVTATGCTSGSSPADGNGASAIFLGVPAGAAMYSCTFTGGTSGRLARATIIAHPLVTNIRSMIVAPAFVTPGGDNVTVLADRLPPNDTGAVFMDGVNQGTAVTDAAGTGVFSLTKPTTGFVHSVQWIPSNGNLVQATALLLGAAPSTPTPTPSPGSCPATITQSSSQVIINVNTPVCGNSQTSFWRAFDLASPSVVDDYNVTSVDIGIERAVTGSGITQPITVNIYKQTSGSFPSGTRVLVGTTTVQVANQQLTYLNIPIAATIPVGTSQLIAEIARADGNGFAMGSNTAPESGPSYISAPDCTIPTPVTMASINYPDTHLVLNVNGSCPAPVILTVTKTADTNDGVCDADCSLREAVAVAGADGGSDMILFNIPANGPGCIGNNCTLTLSSSLSLSSHGGGRTTIDGIFGPNVITLNGNNATQLLHLGGGADLAVNNLNFTGGNGSAVQLDNAGTLTLTNCALFGNIANSGGAFFLNTGSVLKLINITISGNSTTAFGSGGGIWNAGGAVTAVNTSITNNTARNHGGVATFNGGTFTARNTIIAANTAIVNPDAFGTFTSLGNNIMGNPTGNSGFTNGSNGDQVGTAGAPLDPRVIPLGFYGGKTLTQGLVNIGTASTAINTGSSSGAPTSDQRGASRVGVVDIGAFEVNNFASGGTFVAALPVATINTSYSARITANNGPYTYTVTSGALPNGVTLNTNAGVVAVSGTPTQGGTFNFTITATSGANSSSINYTMTVSGGASPTPTATNTATATPTSTPTNTATNTPTSTPTGTATNTPTPGNSSISGTVTYGNAAAPPKFISNATVTGTGSPTVLTTTAAPGGSAGQYTLTGFGAGSYTVSLSKTTGQNSISSLDAARIAQHVAGISLLTNDNQKVTADVTGNNAISSQDAAKIAQVVAGVPLSPPNLTGQWRFYVSPGPTFPVGSSPTSRTYSSVTSNITGDDYIGLLIGEVTGNWTPSAARPAGTVESGKWKVEEGAGSGPERSVEVDLPEIVTTDKEFIVPINVNNVANKGVISYEFNLRYDPSVIQPIADPVDLKDSVSRGLSVVANATEPGLLRVVVYGPMPIDENGVLLNLRFTAIGKPGAVSPLSFERIIFNEGEPRVNITDGQVELSASTVTAADYFLYNNAIKKEAVL